MQILKMTLPDAFSRSIALYSVIFAVFSFGTVLNAQEKNHNISIPEGEELYFKILELDSIYFTAYNSCDIDTQSEMYAENLEFYHDKGGLNSSKDEILKSIKENICGKVTRELIRNSVEVYRINNFGAVEIGMHKFFNAEEPDEPSEAVKFIIIWAKTSTNWQISRVVSLH
jgi:hypothetical protein